MLLAKGYEVHGIKRRSSSFNTERVDHLLPDWHERDAKFFMHFADLADASSLSKLLYRITPDEIYHLGAQSHVRVSFDIPEYTGDITALGTARLLDAIRETGIPARLYNAASSEMYGQSYECPQNESTFRPRSPYGCAKVYSYWMTVNAREGYGLFAVNGILFNHESPRRGEIFVSRKVTRAVARILHGLQTKLYLGNLDGERDWGFAPEYVEGIWRMLQRHGLIVADAETNDVNGGSLRVYVVHRDCPATSVPARRERMEALRIRERSANLAQIHTYKEFGERVGRIGKRLRGYIEDERDRNNEISVYGASTKGNTLLQVFGLDRRLIRSAAERNPEKWGKYTVGTWIPIISEAEARAHANDFLVLPWHFLDEIQIRERDFLNRGGKLIVPLPTPYTIDRAGRHALNC